MNFDQLYRYILESTELDALTSDFDGQRLIYGVDFYFEGSNIAATGDMITELKRIDPKTIMPYEEQGNSPWDADLVDNKWGYDMHIYQSFNDAAHGLREFNEENIPLANEFNAQFKEEKYSTLPDAETLTNKILQKFSHLRDTLGTWKLVAFGEHDIQVFGIEVNVSELRARDMRASIPQDQDLADLF